MRSERTDVDVARSFELRSGGNSAIGAIDAAPDLFGTVPLAGLRSSDDVVSTDEEAELTARIDGTGLSPFRFQGWLGKRLTTSYGAGYDFDAGRLAVSDAVPEWLLPARERAARFAGLDPAHLSQALLIRYDPGAGISWHRDRPFYEHVIGISLGASDHALPQAAR
ncbi:hypothetical protein [Sphingomonas sp. UYP23]